MELWTETNEWIQLCFNVLMLVLPVLAGVAATSVFGAAMINAIKRFYAEWLRPAIDEPTDPIVALIAQRMKRDPQVVVDFIVSNLDAVIAVLPEEAAPKAG
jgi:hypothetical protein